MKQKVRHSTNCTQMWNPWKFPEMIERLNPYKIYDLRLYWENVNQMNKFNLNLAYPWYHLHHCYNMKWSGSVDLSTMKHWTKLTKTSKRWKKIRISKDSTQFELYVMPVTEAADVTKERKVYRLTILLLFRLYLKLKIYLLGKRARNIGSNLVNWAFSKKFSWFNFSKY